VTELAVVDTGALIAAMDRDDPWHSACTAVFARTDLRFIIAALCVAETTFMVARNQGAIVESRFLASLESMDVRAPEPDDWPRIAELVEQYANFPLGGTDASVVALAERLRTDIVVTLDRRHFAAIKPRHHERLRLLPE
jgi:uncharacterized protein